MDWQSGSGGSGSVRSVLGVHNVLTVNIKALGYEPLWTRGAER